MNCQRLLIFFSFMKFIFLLKLILFIILKVLFPFIFKKFKLLNKSCTYLFFSFLLILINPILFLKGFKFLIKLNIVGSMFLSKSPQLSKNLQLYIFYPVNL